MNADELIRWVRVAIMVGYGLVIITLSIIAVALHRAWKDFDRSTRWYK